MAEVLDARADPDGAVAAAAEALARGGLVVLPTDTVYGVGADPNLPGATARVFEAKRRPQELTLPVLAARIEEAETVAVFDGRARALAAAFWPGGLTMVLPRTEQSRSWELGEAGDTVGVRVPADEVAGALLARTGPLAVTSANRSGAPTPRSCEGVREALGDAVDVYVCTGELPAIRPSSIVDLTDREPRIIRSGAVKPEAILAALA